jgi:uncharacterized protein HemX
MNKLFNILAITALVLVLAVGTVMARCDATTGQGYQQQPQQQQQQQQQPQQQAQPQPQPSAVDKVNNYLDQEKQKLQHRFNPPERVPEAAIGVRG